MNDINEKKGMKGLSEDFYKGVVWGILVFGTLLALVLS